jgi:hypothetical protein
VFPFLKLGGSNGALNHVDPTVVLVCFVSPSADVSNADRGVYTCNLHHHYCQVHQSVKIQLNVTKSGAALSFMWREMIELQIHLDIFISKCIWKIIFGVFVSRTEK